MGYGYSGLREAIRNGRGGRKKLAGNTYARLEGDAVVILYHQTDIAKVTAETVTLDNGGWFTSTTKERMNNYALPFGWSIYQKDKKWYLAYHGQGWETATTYPYVNGMTINTATGTVEGVPDTATMEKVDAATKKMANRIDRYAAKYTNEVLAEMVEGIRGFGRATSGDCLWCQFRTTEPSAATATFGNDTKTVSVSRNGLGTPAGDALGDVDHLRSHVMENYVMASLAINAILDRGYRYVDVIMSHDGDVARKAIRHYLRARLLEGVVP